MATKYHNLSEYDANTLPTAEELAGKKFAIIVADWNDNVTHALCDGAVETFISNGISEENVEIYLQYVNVSAEGEELKLISGRGDTAQSALNDIKTKLNKTPSFSHCSLIAITQNMSSAQIKTSLDLCAKLNISLSTPLVSASKIETLFSVSSGSEISALTRENAKNFGFGGHTALFEIQTALLVNEGRFSLPLISANNNLPKVLGLCYFGNQMA